MQDKISDAIAIVIAVDIVVMTMTSKGGLDVLFRFLEAELCLLYWILVLIFAILRVILYRPIATPMTRDRRMHDNDGDQRRPRCFT